jgi:hypothetical protein
MANITWAMADYEDTLEVLYLYLYDSSGYLVNNVAGDRMFESEGPGMGGGHFFADNVDVAPTGNMHAVIKIDGDNRVESTLYAGMTTVGELPTGSDVRVAELSQAALAQFVLDDTGQVTVTDGSVSQLSRSTGSGVTVYPIQSNVPNRVSDTTLKAIVGESVEFTIIPIDAQGNPVDTTGMTLQVVIESRDTTDTEVIVDANIAKTATSYAFTTITSNTTETQKNWACRRTDNNVVISKGPYVVTYAAEVD